MSRIIEEMLYPKRNGIKGKNRPNVIIIRSPYDNDDRSVNFSVKKRMLAKDGFGVINKQMIFYDTAAEHINSALKPIVEFNGEFVLYVNAHGATGWFFGGEANIKSELLGLYQFAKLVENIEANRRRCVNSIILGGCYSAVELYQPDSGNSLISPARLLSMVFPQKKIVGFIGQFADGKVTHLYKEASKGFTQESVQPWDASVLFKEGKAVERYTQRFFCDHQYTPLFIEEALQLGDTGRDDYFEPTLREDISTLAYINTKATNIARKQEFGISQIRTKMHEDMAEAAPPSDDPTAPSSSSSAPSIRRR